MERHRFAALLGCGFIAAAYGSMTLAADRGQDGGRRCAAYFQIVAHCAGDPPRASAADVRLARIYRASALEIIRSRLAWSSAAAVLAEYQQASESLLDMIKGGCTEVAELVRRQGESCQAWLTGPTRTNER